MSNELPPLDDVLEELAGYAHAPEDWIAGELEATGALAIALALREVADAVRGHRARVPGEASAP